MNNVFPTKSMDFLDAQFTSLAVYITDTGLVYRQAVLNNLNLERTTDKAITVFDYKKLLFSYNRM